MMAKASAPTTATWQQGPCVAAMLLQSLLLATEASTATATAAAFVFEFEA